MRVPIRDFAKRPVPGWPSIDLPPDSQPEDYADGVYVLGNIWWPAQEVACLPDETRKAVKRIPHLLLYGYRRMMLLSDRKEVVLSADELVRAVRKVLAA